MRLHTQQWLLRTIIGAMLTYLIVTFVWASHITFLGEPAAEPQSSKELAVKSEQAQAPHLQRTHANVDGRQPCSECHETAVKSYQRTTHFKSWEAKDDAVACGSCHEGNLAAHSNDTSTLVIPKLKKAAATELNAMCLNCHQSADDRSHANLSEHTIAGLSCVSCHKMHPGEEHEAKMLAGGQNSMFNGKSGDLCLSCHQNIGAQFAQTTHHRLKEGVLECKNCHNAHGSNEIKLLRADRKEVCVQCHQDKRGPFTYEHGAVLDEKGCVTCHEPHGGGAIHMLKARDPKTLCMSCHAREAIGMHGVSGIQYNGSVPVAGLTTAGDCTRCHAEIHGSNSTPFLHR